MCNLYFFLGIYFCDILAKDKMGEEQEETMTKAEIRRVNKRIRLIIVHVIKNVTSFYEM